MFAMSSPEPPVFRLPGRPSAGAFAGRVELHIGLPISLLQAVALNIIVGGVVRSIVQMISKAPASWAESGINAWRWTRTQLRLPSFMGPENAPHTTKNR